MKDEKERHLDNLRFRKETLSENFDEYVGKIRAAYSNLIHDDMPEEVIEDAIDGAKRLDGEIYSLKIQERSVGGFFYSGRDSILSEHEGFVEGLYKSIGKKKDLNFLDFWD